MGGLVLLGAVVLIAVLHNRDVALPADRAQRVLDLARTTTMMSAAAVFTVCVIRWQQSAEAPVAMIGTAVLAYGLAVVGVSTVLLPIIDAAHFDSPLSSATRAGGLVAVLLLLLMALFWPPIDTRLSPHRVAAATVVVVAGLVAGLDRLPGLADVLAFGHRGPNGIPQPSSAGRLVLSAVWTGLALALCVRGLRRGRGLLAWSGLMLLALALSELIAMGADTPTDSVLLGSILIQTLAMVFALVGLAGELQRSYLDQRARLFDTQIAMETVEARGRLGADVGGRRRHDLGNALLALQGSAQTLEREHDRLSVENRRVMAEMIASSVQRLHRLMGEDPTAPSAFALHEPVDAAMSTLESAGVEVKVAVPRDVHVNGVRTATNEALRRVADAVWTARPRGQVRVACEEVDQSVRLSVVFEPSAPSAIRLLNRLRQEPAANGNGEGHLGEGSALTVAARLMAEHGGTLTAEPDGETGLAFCFHLPAARAPQ